MDPAEIEKRLAGFEARLACVESLLPKTTAASAAQAAFWDSALARMASTQEWNRELDGTNMSRHFLRSMDFSRYLDDEFAATRAVMSDLGLAK